MLVSLYVQFRKQGHCVYKTEYHLVFATKYRRRVLKGGMGEYLKKVIHEVTKYYPDLHILQANTDLDHLHFRASIPPKMSVSDAVRIVKSNTAKAMRTQFPFLDKVYWGVDGIWSDGYFVSTIGINEQIIRRYIEHQGQEDGGQAKLELWRCPDTTGVSPWRFTDLIIILAIYCGGGRYNLI